MVDSEEDVDSLGTRISLLVEISRRRAHTVAEGEMMSKKREYKDVMQKLVGRQSVHGSTEERRKNKQRQALYQIRQDISEARFETNEAITQIHKGVNKLETGTQNTSSFDSAEKDYGSSETLRAMQDLLKVKQDQAPPKVPGETSAPESSAQPVGNLATPAST
ncbi:uncharacterized protein [Apostichopus japonicus]|uniref:uncharacterized protein isoform X2 n=1 Tax=Stichopus japonicus TaxID=307972 RepID=UPI003AB886E4